VTTEEQDPGRSWPATRAALVYSAGAAVVAVFCYATARLVPGLREAYWAPIAAVVVLYPDREATRKAGVDRFFGTAIGSLVGWASAAWWHQHLVLYGVAVMLAVGLCHAVNRPAAARLCAVTVTVITIIPHPESAHLVALYRFLEVSYGVACALVYAAATDLVARHRRRGATGESLTIR
jgi:uncharacterized membrane protein YgaE (UPF0421/DUF939 family)